VGQRLALFLGAELKRCERRSATLMVETGGILAANDALHRPLLDLMRNASG
jgi:hypothetical protein